MLKFEGTLPNRRNFEVVHMDTAESFYVPPSTPNPNLGSKVDKALVSSPQCSEFGTGLSGLPTPPTHQWSK